MSTKLTSEAHILHISKSTYNEHAKQYWCETSENLLRKWPKTWILTYFGSQKWSPNRASEAHTPQTKLFQKVTKVQNFDLLLGPKWPETSSNEARLMWTKRKLFNKIIETLNFDSFGGPKWPKNLGLWSLSFTQQNYFLNQVSGESSGNSYIIDENQYIDIIWPYLGPKTAWKFGPQGPSFMHTWKYPQWACKPSFMVSLKIFGENGQKPIKFPFFTYFCN